MAVEVVVPAMSSSVADGMLSWETGLSGNMDTL